MPPGFNKTPQQVCCILLFCTRWYKWNEVEQPSHQHNKDSWPEANVILEQSIGRHLTEQLVFGYQPAIVQLHFVGQQSSCFAWEVINLFIDLDRIMDGIDHHLLDTMKRLFGWEYFLGLWGALWAPSFVSLFGLSSPYKYMNIDIKCKDMIKNILIWPPALHSIPNGPNPRTLVLVVISLHWDNKNLNRPKNKTIVVGPNDPRRSAFFSQVFRKKLKQVKLKNKISYWKMITCSTSALLLRFSPIYQMSDVSN